MALYFCFKRDDLEPVQKSRALGSLLYSAHTLFSTFNSLPQFFDERIANSLNSLYLMNWLLFSIAALLNICIINFILEREWWTWRTIATGVKRWQRRRNTRKDDETWYFLEGSASHPSRLVLRALLLLETYNARCSFDPPIMILLDFVLPYCECVRSQSEQTIQ
jgi:hypothetical protein